MEYIFFGLRLVFSSLFLYFYSLHIKTTVSHFSIYTANAKLKRNTINECEQTAADCEKENGDEERA